MGEIRYRRAEPADVPAPSLLPGQGEPGDAADPRMLPYLRGPHHPQQALGPRGMWMALDGDVPVGYIAGERSPRACFAGWRAGSWNILGSLPSPTEPKQAGSPPRP